MASCSKNWIQIIYTPTHTTAYINLLIWQRKGVPYVIMVQCFMRKKSQGWTPADGNCPVCCLFSPPWRATQWRHWLSDLDSLQRVTVAAAANAKKSWLKLFVFPLDLFWVDYLFTAVARMCVTLPVGAQIRIWHLMRQMNEYIFKMGKSEITTMALVIDV